MFSLIRYQDLSDLEASISECTTDDLKTFDTSCFSGKYVTGQAIGDEYFTKLHTLRNDDAQQERNSGAVNGKSSNDGCESVSNDKRVSSDSRTASCESLTNHVGLVQQ